MRTDEAVLVSYISGVDEWHDLVEQFPLFLSFSEMVSLVHQQAFNRPVEQFLLKQTNKQTKINMRQFLQIVFSSSVKKRVLKALS